MIPIVSTVTLHWHCKVSIKMTRALIKSFKLSKFFIDASFLSLANMRHTRVFISIPT